MRVPSLAALMLVLPGAAFAQTKPIITISNIPQQDQQLNTDEVTADAPIQLSWSADVPVLQSYRYEITYDNPRDIQANNDPELVVLDNTPDAGRNMGVVTTGQTYILKIRPSQIVRAVDLPSNNPPLDLDNQPEQRSIVVQVFIPGQEGDDLSAASQSWTFEYDTRPPPPPELRQVFPGENRVLVKWRAPESDGDVQSWEVVYCPNGSGAEVLTTTTATSGYDIAGLPCEAKAQKTQMASLSVTELAVSDGVANGVPVAVAVRSVDDFGNRGPLSNARLQTPAETTDFWELYQELGGQEDGGFCFVATAATGSYSHPMVRVLRLFRDRVLKASYAGTGLVWAYYRWSPPAARLLARSARARVLARVALTPIALFALLWTVLPLLGLLVLIGLLARKLKRKTAPIAGAVALLLILPAAAEAAKPMRAEPTGPLGFGFEFKGGPYLPDMGRAGGGSDGNTAFVRIFGSEANALYQLAFDVQVYRGFGTAGIGGSFGFMQFVGKGVFGVSENKSLDTTVFNILPLTLVAFYRFDWLADHSPVPLVPYVRGGLAYDFWWVTNGTGHVSRFRGDEADNPDDDLPGRGGKIGLTGTAGLALMLNHLEPSSAISLHNSTGIRGTYLFAEVEASKVDGFKKSGFDLSELTWNIGLYLEF